MGSEQSNASSQQTPQMSADQVNQLLEAQRLKYEKKCQDLLKRAAAQNAAAQNAAAQNAATQNVQQTATTSSILERERNPYQYNRNDLQNANRQLHTPQPLYPNLNQPVYTSSPTIHPFSFQTNNNHHNVRPPQDFVFVNNQGQAAPAVFRNAPPAPTAPRDRSVSRNRNAGAESSELSCPTCKGNYSLDIYQCVNNHSSCSNCRFAGRGCGICRQAITSMRNYQMEEYVSQMKVPCPNHRDGCRLHLKLCDVETHVKECPFKEQPCPLTSVFGNCRWKGKLDQIKNHFDSMHPSQRQTDVDTEIRLQNICNNSQQLHLVVIGVYNFIFHLKVSEADGNIYMAAQLIGTKMSANKWIYEIQVYNKSETRRKYTFTDNCSSSSEPVHDIYKDRKCAVLPLAYATTFTNDGALTLKYFIKQCNEGNREIANNRRGRGRGRH